MRIAQEEIFGPVVAIAKFSTESEVITKANDTPYGFGSSRPYPGYYQSAQGGS